MKVVHAQAERILKEYAEQGVPGFEKAEFTLGSPDENGIADLDLAGGAHASPEAFAHAAGILEAPAVTPELKVLEAPKIIGLPNAGQWVTASPGVWEEPDPQRVGDPGIVPSGVTLRWLYDGNEEDPVVIPEGDPHGYGSGLAKDLHIPMAAIGRTIQLRVTRGRTTVYSEPFGPIEGGLTEFTFPGQPVRDTDVVSAEPASRRRSGASAPTKVASKKAQTPTTEATSKPDVVVQEPGKAAGRTGEPKRVKASKKEALAKRAAEEKTPPPAAERSSE